MVYGPNVAGSFGFLGPWTSKYRGLQGHINIRISHAGAKAQYYREIPEMWLWQDPFLYVVFLSPKVWNRGALS